MNFSEVYAVVAMRSLLCLDSDIRDHIVIISCNHSMDGLSFSDLLFFISES